MSLIEKTIRKLLLFSIVFYRNTFSPSKGVLRFIPGYPRPSCIFYPTCSEYAMEVLKNEPVGIAVKKIVKRVSRCHPRNDPQVDMP